MLYMSASKVRKCMIRWRRCQGRPGLGRGPFTSGLQRGLGTMDHGRAGCWLDFEEFPAWPRLMSERGRARTRRPGTQSLASWSLWTSSAALLRASGQALCAPSLLWELRVAYIPYL